MPIKPMLCKPIDDVPTGPDWVIEPKLDGWRAVATIYGDGTVELTTRTGAVIHQVPYVNEALAKLPPDTILDGELVTLGSNTMDGFTATQGVLKRDRVDAGGEVIYVVFDLLRQRGVDHQHERFSVRRAALVKLLGRRSKKLPLRVIEQEPSTVKAHEAHLKAGYEGSVAKRLRGRYKRGSRSSDQYKIKPQMEAEAIATGFYDATPGSKYEGWAVGGITWRLPNGYEGRAAGMDDAERAEMYQAQQGQTPDHWTGNVIELRHHGETADGALRHPQYQRVRSPLDKPTPDPKGSIMTTTTRKPRKTVRKAATATKTKAWMRNYGAMGDNKLAMCVEELSAGRGDAYDRVIDHDGDVAAHIQAARGEANRRGI